MPDTTVAYLLNKMFPKGLADTTFRDPKNTFLALVGKDPAAKGDSFEVALQYSLGGGRSADFATAKRNNNGGAGGKMRFGYADDFAWARVPAKEWQAAKNNGGVTDILDLKFSNAMRKIKRSLATGVAGDGTGNFGRIAFLAGTGSPVVPAGAFRLADWRQTQSIEVGDVIQSNPIRSGSPGTMRAGTAVITKVTRGRASGGLIYYTAVGGWSPVVNDYLYVEGDYGVKINGVQAWIPDVAPTTGDNFGGVDRSVDDVRLAGIRVDMTGQSAYEDALVLGMEEFRTYSADTSIIITSPYDFTRLENELGDKKRIVDIPNRYELGLTGLKMADGSVLTQDPWFPKGKAYPLALDTWTLMSIGDAPHLADEDSLKMLRVSDADAFDAMMRSWANLKCDDPSQNGVILLPA
jgi:hypothetical protein